MKYWAVVKRLDSIIEEEVTLEVEGIEFTGFALICPYKIEEGGRYPVSIGFTVLDQLIIHEINDSKKELERVGDTYQYFLRGLLRSDSIDVGVVVTDEDDYFTDYPNMIGKYVELKVDRISVEFLHEEHSRI